MSNLMPDIAINSAAQTQGTLDWVGMRNIELPFNLVADDGVSRQINTKTQAFVSLDDPTAKGIHMSRLYLLLDELSIQETVNTDTLHQLLLNFCSSHEGLSTKAKVSFEFDYYLRRTSLVSKKLGWKAYPVVINAELLHDELLLELQVNVPYSSTCPCSAALARQLIQQAFDEQFVETQTVSKAVIHDWLGTTEGIVATPHSQRSIAEVKVKLAPGTDLLISHLINTIEETLKTPVQAAVKRADEQEFARLNGQNLMFCEDAARKLQYSLHQDVRIADFWLRVNHYESLHPHDAVSITVKGILNGFQP